MAEGAGVLDSIVAGALATTDADGSEGSDAGEAGIWTAAVAELAGTTTAVEDVSEVCFEHAASTSSDAAAAKVQLPFISRPPMKGPDYSFCVIVVLRGLLGAIALRVKALSYREPPESGISRRHAKNRLSLTLPRAGIQFQRGDL
jgi:hypothetical protein